MNIPFLYHFRATLLALLLGIPWCSATVVHIHTAVGNQPTEVRYSSPANCDHNASIVCSANGSSTLPGLLRFNGKTLVGMEDSLTVSQQLKACADTPLVLMFDAKSGCEDVVFIGSTPLPEQTLFLQHTRLQI